MSPANNPELTSWVPVPEGSDFPIQNLPFGLFRKPNLAPRICTAVGDQVVDIQVLAEHGFFDDLPIDRSVFEASTLNSFIGLGRTLTGKVRNRLSQILDQDLEEWDASELADYILHPQDQVEMLLPIAVGDYTDFYSSMEHAINVGTMFRGRDNALMPNWKHLPVGYHGRASTIVVSGTPIRRPKGQTKPENAEFPQFGPSRLMDFELEMGFVTCKNTKLGEAISIEDAEDAIFGLVLFNDWSARDIQKWEYVPLGPFLGKSFASTISPWIITLDALEPFRVDGPIQDEPILPYLKTSGPKTFDIKLEVDLIPETGQPHTISRSNFRYLYWNMSQQLAHQTVNGCSIRVGDLYASGTISGPTPDSYGSLLELTWRGSKPIQLPDGSTRKFLEDGDRLRLKGFCENNGVRVGFGEASGQILPALP